MTSIMTSILQKVIGVLFICPYVMATSYRDQHFHSEDSTFFLASSDLDGRQIVVGNGGFLNNTLGLLAAGLGLLALGAALGMLFSQIFDDDDSGYSGSGSGYGRKFTSDGIHWESLSILDWIAMAQEAWERYDPSDLECQKRLICEIQQNKSKFGGPANIMVQLFSYLHFAELLSLPEDFKVMLEEYIDASEKGKSMYKDCGEVYIGCDFSVNGMLSKFSNNEL